MTDKKPIDKIIEEKYNLSKECKELKRKNEELNNRMAEVIYRATGGRLSYSNYTLDAIEQAFNDQLEILSDRKVEEETKELNQKLYLAQNEVHSKTEYIQEQREEIKQLEQKNEALKEEFSEMTARKIGYLIESLKYQIGCDRYRKALDEIEEICKQLLDDEFIRSEAESILDIINKVKDENE